MTRKSLASINENFWKILLSSIALALLFVGLPIVLQRRTINTSSLSNTGVKCTSNIDCQNLPCSPAGWCPIFTCIKGYCYEDDSPGLKITLPAEKKYINNWQYYKDLNIRFQYPEDWIEENQQLRGSGYDQTFKSPNGDYLLELRVRGNYSQETGKPFPDIKTYLKVESPDTNQVIIDGQEGIQGLPRAGGENENGVWFFSKDKGNIIEIFLSTITKENIDNISNGQKIFKKILSSVRLTK